MAEMLPNPDNSEARSRHWFRKLVLVTSSLVLAWSASREAEYEQRLEAAIHREMVLGDLKGAVAEYRNLLAQADVPRPVAARALLQTGECMEKLGRRPEAYNSYRRVENEYGDQAYLVRLARTRLAAWVGPRNLDFEDGLPGRVPPLPWTVQAPPNDASYVAQLRRDGCRRSPACVVVTALVNVPTQAGNLMQSFSAVAYRGKTVQLRASLKLEQFFETASHGFRTPDPGDRAQLWLSVLRTNGQVGFSDSMENRPVRSGEWISAEITGTVDDDAQVISLGVMSFGGARAWVDDLSFEVIEK